MDDINLALSAMRLQQPRHKNKPAEQTSGMLLDSSTMAKQTQKTHNTHSHAP